MFAIPLQTYLLSNPGFFWLLPFHSSAASIILSIISPCLHCLEFFFSSPFAFTFFLGCFFCFLFFFTFPSRLLSLSHQFLTGEYHQVHLLINSKACLPETLGGNCTSPNKAASMQDVLSSNVSHHIESQIVHFQLVPPLAAPCGEIISACCACICA